MKRRPRPDRGRKGRRGSKYRSNEPTLARFSDPRSESSASSCLLEATRAFRTSRPKGRREDEAEDGVRWSHNTDSPQALGNHPITRCTVLKRKRGPVLTGAPLSFVGAVRVAWERFPSPASRARPCQPQCLVFSPSAGIALLLLRPLSAETQVGLHLDLAGL